MKIALVTDSLPGYHNVHAGAERACASVGDLLSKQHEVTYLTRTVDADKPETSKNVVEIKRLFDYTTSRPLNAVVWSLLFDPVSFVSSYNALKKYDVVHIQHATQLTLAPILAAKLLGKPVVFSFYDYFPLCPRSNLITDKNTICSTINPSACSTCVPLTNFSPAFQWVLRTFRVTDLVYRVRKRVLDYMLDNVDEFIVLSENWKRLCVANGLSENKVTVVPLPVEVYHPEQQLKPFPIESILFVGWMYPHKGLHVAINALAELVNTRPYLKLIVISAAEDPAYKQQILKIIGCKGLVGNVMYLGKSSYTEIHEMLNRVDVVVVPEQWNIAWSIFLTESMAHGKPIVASNIGDIPEFIDHEQTGLLAASDNPSDFANCIGEFLVNPVKAQRIGSNAKRKLNEIADPVKISAKLNEIYTRCCKE
jgi:glycosyltransferase involved in cell wall biosynthesis